MKYQLPCEIVQDLLPSYIDELVNDVTREAVREHLQECKACSKLYERMKAPEQRCSDEKDTKEIDFLKKNRVRGRRAVVMAVLLAVIIFVALLLIRVYVVGTTCPAVLVDYHIEQVDDSFALYGSLIDTSRGVSEVCYEETDSTLFITVKTTARSFFHKNGFESRYEPQGEITEVVLNGSVIWSDGEQISPKVFTLYDRMTPYVGDISADNAVANAIGLGEAIGPYKNELQTSEEPYGWKILMEGSYTEEEADALRMELQKYGVVLLAAIDNLGVVEFQYQADGDSVTETITESDADAILGQSVKSYVETPADLKRLLETVGLSVN